MLVSTQFVSFVKIFCWLFFFENRCFYNKNFKPFSLIYYSVLLLLKSWMFIGVKSFTFTSKNNWLDFNGLRHIEHGESGKKVKNKCFLFIILMYSQLSISRPTLSRTIRVSNKKSRSSHVIGLRQFFKSYFLE